MGQAFRVALVRFSRSRPWAGKGSCQGEDCLGCCPYSGRIVAPPLQRGTVVVIIPDRKSTRLNSSHTVISYAVFCLKKKTEENGGLAAAGRRRPPRRGGLCLPRKVSGTG